MGDKEDYLTAYRVFFENFAATVNPEDQLPVHIAGYTITESELPGEALYWATQYLSEKQCPPTLMTPLRRIILDEVQIASKKTPNDFGYKSDESVYIALRLMQAVTARVNTVCLQYLDNARLDTLPPPPAQRDMKTVSCATKNTRRAMEDRHVEIGNLEALFGIETTTPTSFYAVYDGHAGSAAATYCAAHLHQYLVESHHFSQDLQRAMHEAFLRTDADFVQKSNQDNACGGSTAVAVAIRARKLLAAWAGDSLALLAKRMRLMQLVRPHKPGREDERDRIESSGGTVMFWGTWRVNGQLAVSRAIGDAQYKPYVTARPEMMTVDLDGDEDFVVVACDGLWDFVSEDDVALAVYRQLAADPDDLKAVTKRLIAQAKRQGSGDNISIIVVFLKDPRDIAADNRPPMDLGLDNALANAPPFAMEAEACKRQLTAAGDDAEAECTDAEADNGVDNSDSDSEDLGPETAVDADDLDSDARPRDPAPPTPPADAVEEGHVDGALLDNVAESGEESEDEWNYFKGEGDREEHNPSEGPDEAPRSETPCQDNSAWETSSVDMNSSPLNPDAPVFIPGSVAGGDVLLAESPRKPLPMDDIELPDVAQFETGAVVRPAELLDLDNCDQLNGHHNVSLDEVKEQLNGNNKYNMDSLGFGFSVGTEPEKVTDTGLIQDFERIQKDTTDFCNIQVFQSNTETNPFATEDNDELLERLKNKERDPMSMSFYQEKDDDTCERLSNKESHVDLNAVQPLPDSDDEDIQPNGVSENETESEKENIDPEQNTDLLGMQNDAPEPNNDIIRFDERKDNLTNNATLNFGPVDNFMEYNISSSNMQGYSNIEFEPSNVQDAVAHTDTPESHKLLFEQIPEIPDGKSSELGFATEDLLEQTESEKDARNIITPTEEISQDIDMETRNDDSPCIEEQSHFLSKAEEDQNSEVLGDNKDDDIVPESELLEDNIRDSYSDRLQSSPLPVEDRLAEVISPEVTHTVVENSVEVDVHQSSDQTPVVNDEVHIPQQDVIHDTPNIKINAEESATDAEIIDVCSRPRESPLPESLLTSHSPLREDTLPVESPLPAESPLTSHSPLREDTLPVESPVPVDSTSVAESPVPPKSPFLTEDAPKSPFLTEDAFKSPFLTEEALKSPAPAESPAPSQSLLPVESPAPAKSPSPLPQEEPQPGAASPEPVELAKSPEPEQAIEPPSGVVESAISPAPSPAPVAAEELPVRSPSPLAASPLPADVPLPRESPAPASPSPATVESSLPVEPSIQRETSPPAEEAFETFGRPETASPLAAERVAPSPSPSPAEVAASHERLSPEVAQEAFADDAGAGAGPAPDIVPDVQRSDLVTDIDIGIPESRAQEICVPVTSEIRHEDGATPPPTPAAVAPALDVPPLSDTPIAADAAPALTAAAAAGIAAATAAAAAVGAKKTIAKKSPTTPIAKAAPKTPARTGAAPSPRTPASATKKPATTTPAAARSSTAARTPSSAPKPAAPKAPVAPRLSAAKPAAPSLRAAPKPSSAAAKEPAAVARAPAARPAPKAPAPRPASAAAAPKPATKPAPITRPPAGATRPATAPAPRPAPARPKPAETKPKPAEKKPLANGDVKDGKPAPKPAPARPAAITRPAPRPAPRAPAPRAPPAAPATAAASAPTKTAAPKPAARTAAARPLDKQSKDLANKRITAKAAPPRTAATKTAPGTKSVPVKVPKKPLAASAQNGLTNGGPAPAKAPPSPPADSALLPDVIA